MKGQAWLLLGALLLASIGSGEMGLATGRGLLRPAGKRATPLQGYDCSRPALHRQYDEVEALLEDFELQFSICTGEVKK